MFDFVCLGDAIYDIFIKPHEVEVLDSCKKARMQVACEPMLCFGYGEKISVEETYHSVGGSAVNVAVGFRKLGLKSAIITEIGSDNAAEQVEKKLKKEKVDLSYIHKTSRQNSFSIILMYKNEKTVLVYKAIKDYSKLGFLQNPKTKWFYVSSLGDKYEKIYKKLISLISQKSIKLALNPGKRQLEERKHEFLSVLKLCEVLILNKHEAEILVKARFPLQPKEIFAKLSELGAKINVITDGVNGAYVSVNRNEVYKVDAFKDIKVSEATGAGDAFSAGFLARLFKATNQKYSDDDIKEALIWGVINGAKATETIGAQPGLQTKNQLEKLVKNPPKVYKI